MQHNQKKQFVTTGRFHQGKGYAPYFHQTPPGDVGGFSGGPGGAAGTSLRLSQYSTTHPPPAAAPQPPQGPPQLRAQAQPPPHNPHNASAGAPPHSQQHHTSHTHATLTQHTQHHQVLQGGGVGGHGTGGVGTGVGQVGGVPPGPSPAPPGPPQEINTHTLPPGSTQQIQQGSGGSLPVVSAGHNMMYPTTTQNQPQGPQPNAQNDMAFCYKPEDIRRLGHVTRLHASLNPTLNATINRSGRTLRHPEKDDPLTHEGQFYPHPGGPNAPPHIHSTGQPRQVAIAHSQHMPNFPVMPPNMMQFYPSTPPSNVLYQISPNGIRHILNGVPAGRGRWLANRMSHPIDIEFQPMGPPRQAAPHSQPGQYHPTPMPQAHPQGPFQPIQYPPQGNKHEAAPITQITYRQPQPVFYPPTSQPQQMKTTVLQAPQRERKCIAIVDPNTGKNILDDINNDKTDSNKSSESSAGNTPAPSGTPPNKAEQVAIAAQFAAEVAKMAAEKDTMERDTVESVVRTNKPSEPSPSNIIISDSRESKEPVKNSIGNKVEHVKSEPVDNNGVEKTVPEPTEVMKTQPKTDLTQVSPAFPLQQPVSILTTPVMLPQMPPQAVVQQLSQQVPQPQQIPQQLPQQPPLQVSPQPPVQVSPQPPPQAPQQTPLQGPQQPPQQQKPQQPPQQPPPQQQQQQQQPPPQPPPQQQQQPQQPPQNQLTQQPPQKQKSPSPQQNVKVQQNAQPTPPPTPQVVQQQPPPEVAIPQPKQQPHLPSPPPQAPQQNASGNEAEQKMEDLTELISAVQIETPAKPEPTLPVKQPSPTPSPVLPTPPPPKEEEVAPEPQPAQSKRRGGPREENTPARENVEENSVQPIQPQKAATPPAVQPPNKLVSQPAIQNAKEKEKTPEPAQPSPMPTPPPPQKPASLPPSKEATPQPAMSPTPSEESSKSERSSKEREVNNIEVEVNNIHEDEKDDDKLQLKYSYKDDQWSPVNPDGKRQYDRRFLLELQNNPLSLKKPESLPNLEVVRDGPGRHKAFDPRVPVAHISSGPDFTPDYVKGAPIGSKGSRPGPGGRPHQPRPPGGGQVSRSGRGGQGKVIVIPLSTGREPKLKTTENAWKPSVVTDSASQADEQAAMDEVVKRMRGILNKLTPEKFEKLVGTVRQMPIDTTDRLSAVIDLIFEKAVDEQGFSSTYASLCQVLSKMSVRDGGSDEGKSEVKFRNLIINKCQKEFEKDNMEEIKPIRMKEIEDCPDVDKKAELKAKWDYEETKMRQRSVGNIRFIGELYKLRMLTSPIMMRIISTLLQKRDEESLECLCKLLTTIGKILESQCNQQPKPKEELEKQFRTMNRIVGDRLTNSRVRFLMMDVIDLRGNNWVPRREDNKPKTKAQVHEEVKREEIEQQMALATTPNRRDDRDRDRDRDRKRSRDNRAPPMSDSDGWNTVASAKSRTSFDSSRLKNTFNRPGASESKEVILRGAGFGNWARGSSGGGLKDHDDVKQQENRFNVLGDSMGGAPISGDNRRGVPMGRLAPGGGPPRQGGFGSKSMPPPSSEKENTLSIVKKFVGNDRSKSTSRPESRENSIPRETETLRGPASIDAEAAEKFAIAIIEEYAHNADPDEAKLWIKDRFSLATIKHFVQYSLEWVLDRDATKRKRVGQLYHDLLVENLLSAESFLEGVQETLSMTEDFVIDIPQVCDYFGEIFAPCLNDNAVSLHRLLELAKFANSKSATVFACIIAKAATLMSPNKVADLWNSSGLSWSNIVPASANVDEFLAKQHVEFTVDSSKSTTTSGCSNNSGWDPQKVEAEFLKLFKRASNAEIFDWIEANIGNDAKTSKFIRALVTALVESQAMTSNDGSSIRTTEDFEGKMKNRLSVVRRYVDSSDKLELQCIYALQALSVKHQHPPGLLEKCFNAFYDSEVVSEEAFDEWVKSHDPEEQEGKGVCVATVKGFMRWLKEAEVEEPEAQG